MSFLSWLKSAFQPETREDPRFGKMTYQHMSGKHGPSYWEGSGTFAGVEVEYFVDGDDRGPSDAQRALRDRLEKHWKEVEPRLAQFLERNATADELGTSSRRLADWSLGSFAIPAVDASVPHFEIGYVEVDGGELLDFEMVGFDPQALRIGG